MSITQLAVLTGMAILIGHLNKGRSLALLGFSAFVLYWLQPPQSPINLTFWLPTATLAITVITWLLTSTPETRGWKQNWRAVVVLLAVILLVDANQYFRLNQVFVTETPRLQWVGAALVIFSIVALLTARLRQFHPVVFILAVIALIGTLALIKLPSAMNMLIEQVSAIRGKETTGSFSLSWLGFSYISFRLLHTILDRRAGRLPSVSLEEYVNYVVFFPSITSGPIDRLERFSRDFNHPVTLDREGWLDAGTRFFVGMFKKFVIADLLATIALTSEFAARVHSAGWMWVFLYAYSLRLYFDFSGYTDIAIGLGRLLGVRLPENFNAPYLKPNLTLFWNSWHITLTQWFRAYFFNPLTRALRSAKRPLPVSLVIFVTQVSTMILIGLWHGMTATYVLWGVWHGLGLFVHNRWSDFVRRRNLFGEGAQHPAQTPSFLDMFLTFNFVTLGWLFFIMPTPASVWQAALKLFGVG